MKATSMLVNHLCTRIQHVITIIPCSYQKMLYKTKHRTLCILVNNSCYVAQEDNVINIAVRQLSSLSPVFPEQLYTMQVSTKSKYPLCRLQLTNTNNWLH